MKRLLFVLLAPLLALPGGLLGQSPGTIELSVFGNYTWFDNALRLDDQFGVGGTLGLYFVRHVAVELEGLYTPTAITSLNRDVNNYPPRARLTANIPLGGKASSIQLGAGYVRSVYRNSVSYEDNGITGLAGFRLGLTQHFAFRLNGTLDYMPKPSAARLDHYMNWGAQAGISFLFGNKYDKDGDKIADNKDKCPSTQKGQAVDPAGCSASQRDTDHDGLADAGDRCPATPAGEKIDPEGCGPSQRDLDADKVADNLDKCPGTPTGETANGEGCAPSQLDSDRDGVMDLADRCPNTNTDRGPAVDEKGCARVSATPTMTV